MKKIKTTTIYLCIWALYVVFAFVLVLNGARTAFNKNQYRTLSQIAESKYLQFEAGLVSQLPLALQMANVPSTIEYMENPTDPDVFARATKEFQSFQDGFLSKSSYWMSEIDMLYYYNMQPSYVVDPKLPENYWWDLTVKSDKDYNFNINYNEDINAISLWVNACVRNKQGRGIGMVGTGIPLDGFTKTMFENLDKKYTMYLFNKYNEITGSTDLSLISKKVNILEKMPELKGYTEKDTKDPVLVKTSAGVYLIYPIPDVEWKIVIFQKYTASNMISSMGGPLAIAFLIGLIIAGIQFFNQLGKPLTKLKESITGMSSGNADLTKRIDVEGITTIKTLTDICIGFNEFLAKLAEVVSALKESKEQLVIAGSFLQDSTQDTTSSISQIIENIDSMTSEISSQSQSVEETAGAVNQIASNIESLNRLIESQSTAVTQASAAVEQMMGNINSVSISVQKMSNAFLDLENKAVDGVRKQNDVNVLIADIEKESQALQEANSVISRIAQQTNLLAMNAAIEAAHAGEAGKGFSVVSDEIRKLSENSGTQSQTIGKQLDKIIESITNIVNASQEASTAFNTVASGINSTSKLVHEMTNAMNEQNEGTKQIIDALTSMNDTSSQVKNSSIEMAEGNKAILEEVRRLQNATCTIQDEMVKMSDGARKIDETGSGLSTLASQMDGSIKQIGEQVDQFKV